MQLRVTHLEGWVKALQAAALEATDEHRCAEVAEARAAAREAQAHAEECRHLIEELRDQLQVARVRPTSDGGGKVLG